ncbi:peroxiredoxin-like family protein [Amnibacterium sp. CER49]|uniref:peroxiredoxin-like family protein n=1 Tax=Amnibacterium sp. CER49 TaxID=3039161 RepID=UPI002447967D|nr:peroxiredoxin-like family protein [Amnibacterium sp. CER49]MDH2444913.1 peroxiredoxin-like family protein [Amnibacterium sp. CER49]
MPQTIAEQVDEFNVGFNDQIGPRLADVFAREQQDLVEGGVPAGAVSVGDVVPDSTLLTPEGTTTTLSAVLAGRPAVLVFYRGAWCPYCNIALRTYQRELLPELDRRGVALVAISPQKPERSQEIAEAAELGFPVLSDPGNALVRTHGIRTEPSAEARSAHTDLGFDVADYNADETGDVPYPTVLVVDADRAVRFADVHVDYTTRTEVPTILAAVDAA